MSTPVRASDQDLRALAAIASQDRPDLPDGEGLPPSLLADLMGQVRCDVIAFEGFDSERQETWFLQAIPDRRGTVAEDLDLVHWQHYWHCQPCSYPDRTGDLRSIIKIADFYSARQWHSIGTYCDIYRPQGFEHDLMLTLPAPHGPDPGPGRTMRLFFFRGSGPDFSERDRAVLTLLRPHLERAYLDAERRRHPVPRSPAGRRACCTWWPPGAPIPRSPAVSASPREPCAPTWKTSTNGCRSPAAPPPSPAPSQTRQHPDSSFPGAARCVVRRSRRWPEFR